MKTGLPTDAERIAISQKYGCLPESGKCAVFFWLDQGVHRAGLRFLNRKHLYLTADSLRKYCHEWQTLQQASKGRQKDGRADSSR